MRLTPEILRSRLVERIENAGPSSLPPHRGSAEPEASAEKKDMDAPREDPDSPYGSSEMGYVPESVPASSDWESALLAITARLQTLSASVDHLSRRCDHMLESFRRRESDLHVDLVHQRMKMVEIADSLGRRIEGTASALSSKLAGIEDAVTQRVAAAESILSTKLDAYVLDIFRRQESLQALIQVHGEATRPVLATSDVLVTRIDDFVLAVPQKDWILAAYYTFWGTVERGVTLYLESILRPGMVFVDIGANVGIHTLHAARAVAPDGMVYSFEPDPNTFCVLEQNVRANGLKRVELHRLALLDRACEVPLHQTEGMSGLNSIFGSSGEGASVLVQATTLDEAIPNAPHIDVIKIDAEGAEPFIWRGMQRILAENAHIRILLEFAPIHLRRAGIQAESFLRDISAAGFTISRIGDESGDLTPFDPTALGPADGANLLLEKRAA